ncbi:hypothetical protein CORC01_08250 [Colletotrichum orchidophilum]|uniref:Uncharacterized protein n=1 Tax=Colletotrichum orchidophilum TaxID=1209926 RepID=A0A1G4B506_9PEZI|nr:uncharacterized protein CORC01_08250 [Colletotrichum orchidophilum]OHE96487.1 hypothetical protein CORC01_08250 [Colletotrichum orchidophilum]
MGTQSTGCHGNETLRTPNPHTSDFAKLAKHVRQDLQQQAMFEERRSSRIVADRPLVDVMLPLFLSLKERGSSMPPRPSLGRPIELIVRLFALVSPKRQ